MKFLVKRLYQYKLSKAPFQHDKNADKIFDTEELAEEYVRSADSGFGGDMRYRYEIIGLKKEINMINSPLFFKSVFNREDGSWNSYSIHFKSELYWLLENGELISKFSTKELAINYFEAEFNLEYKEIKEIK